MRHLLQRGSQHVVHMDGQGSESVTTRTPRTRRRVSAALCSAAVIGVICAGCGSSSSGGGSSAQNSSGSASPHGQAPATTVSQANVANLRIAYSARVTTVDPLQAGSATDIGVTNLLAGTLYAFPASGAVTTSPSLASGGSFGPGDRSFTVTLKPGLKFSDGTALTSADVVATFERAATFKSNEWGGDFTPIKTVRAMGAQRVHFTFSRPFPSFTTLMAYPAYAILEKREIGPKGVIPTSPIMAGPYMASGSLTGNTFTLVRNQHFVGPAPAAARLTFTVVSDSNARLLELSDKQFDFAFDIDPTSLQKPPSSVLTQYAPTYGFSLLQLNNKQAPFNNVKVRRAVALAVDRQKISEVSWAGLEKPLGGFFPSSFPGLSKAAVAPDPKAAKQLLAGTPCASGCSVTLTVPGSLSWASTAAVIVQSSLKSIGINVSINTVDLASLFQQTAALKYEMALGYYSDFTTVPEGLPSYCFSDPAVYEGCLTGYSSPAAARLVLQAAQAQSQSTRDAAYRNLDTVFAHDQPFVPLTNYSYTSATAQSASGLINLTPAGFIEIAPLKG